MNQIRTNKTKQSITWPSTALFTIKELGALNSQFVPITLRVRLAKAIEEGKIVEIAAIPGGKGRPEKVFTKTPVTQAILDRVKTKNYNLVDSADKLINVISVKNTSKPTAIITNIQSNNSSLVKLMS